MPKRRSSRGCVLGLILVVAAVVCGFAGVGGLGIVTSLGEASPDLAPLDRIYLTLYLAVRQRALDRPAGGSARTATLDVEPGQNARSVADELAGQGVLDDPALFTMYSRYRGLDTGIQAGRYEVSGAMTIRDLAERLQKATTSRYTATIPEGWRREQVARLLGDLGLSFSAGDFLAATRVSPPPSVDAPAEAKTVEGFLFPDTYTFDPRMTAAAAVDRMTQGFESHLDPSIREGFAAHGLTVFEAVTLASIVEREAVLPSERPLIASVFLNRLARAIPLQADPTVQYAIGWQDPGGYWKETLTATDLQFDSPYNTYLYDGLPPGPIASPGLDSLEAVANPAETDYLFFRAACDGTGAHRFAATFEEHVANACP